MYIIIYNYFKPLRAVVKTIARGVVRKPMRYYLRQPISCKGWIDDANLRPFQQDFGHVGTMEKLCVCDLQDLCLQESKALLHSELILFKVYLNTRKTFLN